MKRPTRTDVARHCGVSVATVSYAFSNSGKISERTRHAVMKAARALGYRPNLVARSLTTRTTMQLSMILDDIANPVYTDMIVGFESAAMENGYIVNICNGRDYADQYFEHVFARGIDGFLIEVLPHRFRRERLLSIIDAGMHVVLFGNHGIDTTHVACFEIDYLHGMDLAVGHLHGLGHRRIAYLSGLTRAQRFDRRIEGFQRAMKRRGMADDLIVTPEKPLTTSVEDGEGAAGRLLASGRPFSAIICTNDLMAIGALRTLAAGGVRVPDDVSVVGIDNASVAAMVTPALTTVASDYGAIGRSAFTLLHDAILHGKHGYILHAPRLVVRDSTGPRKGRR